MMKRQVTAIVPAILLAATSISAAHAATDRKPAAALLDQALKGRTAGEPVPCINLPQARSSSIVGNAIIYKNNSRRWFVNVPDGGSCPLAANRTIITRTPSTQLCRGDIVTISDLVTGFTYGSCGLGSFVPYTK